MASSVCSICYENIECDGIKTPCGHTYHNSCLTPWLISKTSCPMCRHSIGEYDSDEEYDTDEDEEVEYIFDVSYISHQGLRIAAGLRIT